MILRGCVHTNRAQDRYHDQQECIPISFVPPVLYRMGVSPSRGGLYPRGSLSERPLCGQTDACENITLPQTSFAGGNKNGLLELCGGIHTAPRH